MKKTAFWLLAIVITLVLSIYQRMTGPTHPKRVTVELNGQSYSNKLPRSGVRHDEEVTLKDIPADTQAQLHYRRYPTSDDYTTVDFTWTDGALKASLPVQPVAGKLQYYITVDGKDYLADEPIVIRFRNDVPASILVPHILLMFAAMLFAVYTLLLVLTRREYAKWLKITVATLFVGGLSFLFFVAALATLKWKYNKWVVGLAVVFMIAIFSIPHSAYGSEFDYSTQKINNNK